MNPATNLQFPRYAINKVGACEPTCHSPLAAKLPPLFCHNKLLQITSILCILCNTNTVITKTLHISTKHSEI
jgi:hypothetical protein